MTKINDLVRQTPFYVKRIKIDHAINYFTESELFDWFVSARNKTTNTIHIAIKGEL